MQKQKAEEDEEQKLQEKFMASLDMKHDEKRSEKDKAAPKKIVKKKK